jgi:hypothetical protein
VVNELGPEGLIVLKGSSRCTEVATELSVNSEQLWRDPRISIHLARCPECRRFRRQVLEQREEIREAFSITDPPGDLRAKIEQATGLAGEHGNSNRSGDG